jgi:catechol-2,3-dioxygenase
MPQVTGLAQVHVSVRDLATQVGFYRDVVGLPVLIDAGSMVFLGAGATRLYLSAPEDESLRSNPLLYLGVDDIDAFVGDLRQRDVRITAEPHVVYSVNGVDLWLAFFTDPEGNLVGLMQERAVGA